MKKVLFLFLVSSLTFLSCDSSDSGIEEKAISNEKEDSKFQRRIQPLSRDGRFYEVSSIVRSYNSEAQKRQIINQLSTTYLDNIYVNSDFDSRYQVAGAIFEENRRQRKIAIKYARINLQDMGFEELTRFMASVPINYSEKEDAKKEKLYHQCVGGKNDSKTLVLDRPDSKISGAIYADKLSQFASECLDGGGCLEICKLSTSSLTSNIESLVFNNNMNQENYRRMIQTTIQMLHQKLDRFNVRY